MRVGYCRVSTKSAEQSASIETQAQRLRDYGCDRVLVDHGISGFREKGRKGSAFPELIDLILGGVASEVIVSNFDRTQRRAKWGAQLLDALETTGCRLYELDTGAWLDPANNPADVLMAQIRSAVQENESRTRKLKVTKALAAARARGEYASGKVPFGYAVQRGQIVEHPTDWPLAKERWQQLEAVEFNFSLWVKRSGAQLTPRGAKAWACNPTLRGQVRNRPELSCPALITAEQWDRAQRCMAARSLARGVGLTRQVRLFTGLVRCDACGKKLHTITFREPRRLKCLTRRCERYGQGLREEEVRRQVIRALTSRHREMAVLAARPEVMESDEIRQLRADISTLKSLSEMPGLDELIAAQEARLRILTTREAPLPRYEQLSRLFEDPATLDLASDEELRAILLEFVAGIEWHGGWESITITLQ